MKDIFDYRNVKCLSQFIIEQIDGDQVSIIAEQDLLKGSFDLLPIQHWFFDKVTSGAFTKEHHWNQSFLVKIPETDIGRIANILEILSSHHDLLRVTYSQDGQQIYHQEINIPAIRTLDVSTISSEKLQTILTDWQSQFNIYQGPLWQVGYLEGYSDGSARLYFALHHLIVDAVSWRILIEDIKALYNGDVLGDKTSSYRQWVNAVKDYAKLNTNELSYWEAIKDKQQSFSNLSLREPSYSVISFDNSTTIKLLKRSTEAYHTEINDLLLTSLAYSLKDILDNDTFCITLEGHGREDISNAIDVTKTLGWFTTVFPVRLELQDDIGSSIRYIKEYLRNIPNKGIGYGALKYYEESKILKNHTLPLISFNYLGQFDSADGYWQITPECSGVSMNPNNKDESVISFNGFILDGRLEFNISSAFIKYDANNIGRAFKNSLNKIIDHCCSKENPEYTISDLKDFEPYVEMHTDKKERLFLFPPAFGGAENYLNNIVPRLNNIVPRLNNISLTLFNNFYEAMKQKLEVEFVSDITIEKLAAEYIFILKTIQPKGPYNLFGWSVGGNLAFEAARQLVSKGEEVKSIILLDTYFNIGKALEEYFNSKKISDISSRDEMLLKVAENDINYKYNPKNTKFNKNTNIILFTTSKCMPLDIEYNKTIGIPEDVTLYVKATDEHYTLKTTDNYLSDILADNKFEVISLNSSHFDWIDYDDEVDKVANIINKKL